MVPTPTVRPKRRLQPQGVVVRRLHAMLPFIFLVFGLVFALTAAANVVVEQHYVPPVEGVSSPDTAQNPAPSCHPGLTCSAFAGPWGSMKRSQSMQAVVWWPGLSHLPVRLGGPSVNLPPPRRLI